MERWNPRGRCALGCVPSPCPLLRTALPSPVHHRRDGLLPAALSQLSTPHPCLGIIWLDKKLTQEAEPIRFSLLIIQDKGCRNWESVSQSLKLDSQADSGIGVTIWDHVNWWTIREYGNRPHRTCKLLSSTFCPRYLFNKPFGFLSQELSPRGPYSMKVRHWKQPATPSLTHHALPVALVEHVARPCGYIRQEQPHFLSNGDKAAGTRGERELAHGPFQRPLLLLTRSSPECCCVGHGCPWPLLLERKGLRRVPAKAPLLWHRTALCSPHWSDGSSGAEGSRHGGPGSTIRWRALIDPCPFLMAGQTLCVSKTLTEGQGWKGTFGRPQDSLVLSQTGKASSKDTTEMWPFHFNQGSPNSAPCSLGSFVGRGRGGEVLLCYVALCFPQGEKQREFISMWSL